MPDASSAHSQAQMGIHAQNAGHDPAELQLGREALLERIAELRQFRSKFLDVMSHELHAPINAIHLDVQLLETGLLGPVTPAQRETLARVQRSQYALHAQINDLLNLARLNADRVEFLIEPVDVREIVTATLELVQPELAQKQMSVEVELPTGLLAAADRDKLRQILLNLFTNALKFTESGGRMALNLGRRPGGPDDVVMLRVVDSGCGIARDKQDAVFEPFVQLYRPQLMRVGGVGLGLAISRGLARGMGGDLRVRSQEGLGSVFTLTLPLGG